MIHFNCSHFSQVAISFNCDINSSLIDIKPCKAYLSIFSYLEVRLFCSSFLTHQSCQQTITYMVVMRKTLAFIFVKVQINQCANKKNTRLVLPCLYPHEPWEINFMRNTVVQYDWYWPTSVTCLKINTRQ